MHEGDREETIFLSLLGLPPEEREKHLAEACGTDAELQRRIAELLNAHDSRGKFLDSPVPESAGFCDGLTAAILEKPGDRIGRYKLMEQIGEGGCGVVYVAEQEQPVRRRVALKVIKLGMDTKQVIARFEAERQALALMDHPNIAKVLDAGATGTGRPYFVMELVRGLKITEYCDHQKLSTPERLGLFMQVCRAIQHAHQKGVIHRDIKPSNILVTVNDGLAVPKVIDFGIAKATQGRLTEKTIYTAFEQFIGTPAYMSPEQAAMTSLDVDTRSDIYSLGVLLYELLTGTTPFETKDLLAEGLDSLRRTISEREPVRPSTRLSHMQAEALTTAARQRGTEPPKLVHVLRGDLDWIAMKALEKDRARRYETANELARDLERHLRNEPVLARPPSGYYFFKKLVRRHQAAFAAGGIGAALLLLTLAMLSIANIRITEEKDQKDSALRGKDAALVAAEKSEARAREQLFAALQSQAQARRHSGQRGQRLESLAALQQAATIRPTSELRDEAIAAMALPDVRPGPVWQTWQPITRPTAFDAGYQLYAQADTNGLISIRTIPDNREVQTIRSSPESLEWTAGRSLLLSPDGRYLAKFEANYRLKVWRVEDAQPAVCCEPEGCWALAFSPNGRELAVGQRRTVLRFDLASGRELNRWDVAQPPYSLEFAPDNQRLAIGYSKADIVSVYGVESGGLLAELPIGPSLQEVIAWHPDGRHLAVGGSDPRVQIWDLTFRRRISSLEGHIQQIVRLSFHPKGELLASLSWEPFFRLWHPSSGRQLMRIAIYPAGGFSPDGLWVGVFWPAENQAQLLEVVPSEEYHTFLSSFGASESGFYQGDISPDGTLLALAGEDGVRLWDLFAGRELVWLHCAVARSAYFRKKGEELITCGPGGGLQRWSVQRSGKKIQVEQAQVIPTSFTPMYAVHGSGESSIGCPDEKAGKVFLLDTDASNRPPVSVSHTGVTCLALSPDGQWFATSGWHSEKALLWDARSGKLVHEFHDMSQVRVAFSPDSKQLVISRSREFLFYDVATLQLVRKISRHAGLYPGYLAWSADGQVLALELAAGIIDLQETATGRTIARLEDPSGDLSTWFAFTPDNTQLIVVSTYAGAIHRWDLRATRNRLKSLGLEQDWPELPPLPSRQTANDERAEIHK